MAKKIRVGILFGGRSAEHEVSLQSAKNIFDAIDTNKYEVVLIGIDKLPATSERIRQLAIKTFSALCCEGMARVDFFLTNDEEIIVNEINTIPGFTRMSMYPKLWEAIGISYSELIDKLIELAIERFEREKGLKTDRV